MQETPHTISASRQASSAPQVCSASGRAATVIPQLTSAQGGSEDIGRYIDGTKTPEQLNRLINQWIGGQNISSLLGISFLPLTTSFLKPMIMAATAPSAWNTHEIALENPTATIQCHISTEREKRIKENRKLLQLIAKVVLYCGRQCIALRGDKERFDQPGNPGNFRALLMLMSEDNDMLAQNLRNANRVTYISPQSQNEMIEVIRKKFVQTRITQVILDARFFSILADEATSHNEEKLAIVIRFADSNGDIREEFIDFKSLERTTGAAISNSILECLRDLNIPIRDCRGQGYDGAAAMSSEGVGIQAEIRRRAPKAVYIHCAGQS